MLFKALFEISPDALLVVTEDGDHIELANKQVEKLFGYSLSELIGQPIEFLIPERYRDIHRKHIARYVADPHTRPMGMGLEIYGKCKDGREPALDIQLSPFPWGNGIRILAVIRDVTENKRRLTALIEEKERSAITLHSIGDAVLGADLSLNVTYLNKAAEQMTGWSREEAVGQPLAEVLHIIDSNTRESALSAVDLAISEDAPGLLNSNVNLIRRNGGEVPIEDSFAPIHDAKGKIVGVVIIFRDVSKWKDLTSEMRYLAQHDVLTQLPNRVLLNDRLAQAIASASRRGIKLAVLFLDLDHFKHVNDSLGHGAGDRLLQSVAERLRKCVRGSDTISRTGGDEFVILLAELEEAKDASISAEKILAELSRPHHINENDLLVTVSIGISIYPDDGHDPETLVKNADMAMYDAKDSGRNNYQFFTPEMNRRSVQRQTIESALRLALERAEFALYYQPKINLQTKGIVGAEALIRWRHAERGLLYPAQFIPIAEECGLIMSIDRWVLREGCRQIRAWEEMGRRPVPVSFNISAAEFRDKKFLEYVRVMLNEIGLDPGYLELELTESVLMQNAEAAAVVLKALKSIGVRLAIDDFGTGYSSLSYLSHFPIDVLKIDQSFIHEINTHQKNATIINAVIGMCDGLRCQAVAEGVETQEQANFLRNSGCLVTQGYYFGRPMVPEEFFKLLSPQ